MADSMRPILFTEQYSAKPNKVRLTQLSSMNDVHSDNLRFVMLKVVEKQLMNWHLKCSRIE